MGSGGDGRLDSWKAIADYLARDVTTAIRWERNRGLPVHRVPGGGRQAVFAYRSEIDAWMKNGPAAKRPLREKQGAPAAVATSHEQGDDGDVVAAAGTGLAPSKAEQGSGAAGTVAASQAQGGDEDVAATAGTSPVSPSPPETSRRGARTANRWHHPLLPWLAIAAGAAFLVVLAAWQFEERSGPSTAPRIVAQRQLTDDREAKGQSLSTDGSTVYFEESEGPKAGLASVPASGGATALFSSPLGDVRPVDISPDGRKLLVIPNGCRECPLWILPRNGLAPQRVGGILAHAAAWSPDGNRIAYINGGAVYVAAKDGSEARKLAAVEGAAGDPAWSPDGKIIRFTMYVPFGAGKISKSLWEVKSDGAGLRPVFPGWHNPSRECCGRWTRDGRYFVFQVDDLEGSNSEIWATRVGKRSVFGSDPAPFRLTHGPLHYRSPLPGRDGKSLYVVGTKPEGELTVWDATRSEFVTYLGGVPTMAVAFSRDGRWAGYISFPDHTVWKMRPDGGEKAQLTFAPFHADGLSWSPDGRQLALYAQEPGKPHKVYLLSAERLADPQPIRPEDTRDEGIPTWSRDGKRIAYGEVPAVFGHGTGNEVIHVYDLTARQDSAIPGSNGLWTARWSPDGQYIAALTVGWHQRLKLYHTITRRWRDMKTENVQDPVWSHDSKYLYYRPALSSSIAGVYRVRVTDGETKLVAAYRNMRIVGGGWCGLAPDDSPLVLRDIGVDEIYALDIDWP